MGENLNKSKENEKLNKDNKTAETSMNNAKTEIVSNSENNKSKENLITISLIVLIIIAVIDILLVMKLINFKTNTKGNIIEEDSVANSTSNIADNNKNDDYEEVILQNYSLQVPSKYNVNVQDNLATIESTNLKAIVTINDGTMENIQNNLNLLKTPIEEQGGVITLEPELQTINNKDIIVLEYKLDEKDYIIAYTELDENNIIDMIAEKEQSEGALELLVKMSNK